MTYDATAKQLAVKVIGTVESNLDYSAVNYNDPITVGIAQWYGTRAAAILDRMRTENTGQWYGVAGSVESQLITIPSSNTYWDTRYLTQDEGVSLLGVMGRNAAIQNDQLITDLEAYKAVAVAHGIDPDANTATMLYFFTMYHQGPVYALEILAAVGGSATLAQIHQGCLTHVSESASVVVLGKYGSRYNTAFNLIQDGGLTGTTPPPPPAQTVPNGNADNIRAVGDSMLLTFTNGEKLFYYSTGHGLWMPQRKATPTPVPVQPPPPADNGNWGAPLAGAIHISSPYGPRPTPPGSSDINGGFHYGVDFVPDAGGSPDVIAPAPMVVTVAWSYGTPGDPSQGTAGEYCKGHTVDGAYTFNFFHMVPGSLAVAVGDTLTKGQKIGVMGGSGNVTGPHLHFETYQGNIASPWPPPYGNPVDPVPVLRAHGVPV